MVHNINPQVTNVILGRQTNVLWGDKYLLDAIGHVRYAVSPLSFFQVNPIQTKVLYDLVQERRHLMAAKQCSICTAEREPSGAVSVCRAPKKR